LFYGDTFVAVLFEFLDETRADAVSSQFTQLLDANIFAGARK
jgi:hypothetical protein